MEAIIVGILGSAVAAGAVIVIAATGEVLSERAGVLNLGIEGMMAMGAVGAIVAVNEVVPDASFGFLAAMLLGLGMGSVLALATVTFKANQVLCGLALSYVGLGLSGHIGRAYAAVRAPAQFETLPIPVLSRLPLIGEALFQHNALVYVAYFGLPVAAAYVLFQTRHGLFLRSVGESPAAADASGIPVDVMRFVYVAVGGAMAAMAGAYLTLGLTSKWSEGVTAGRGWIAIALVFFSAWNPLRVIPGALLFGGVTSIGFIAQSQGWGIPTSFLAMAPYVVTILYVALPRLVGRGAAARGRGIGPAALAQPYFRE